MLGQHWGYMNSCKSDMLYLKKEAASKMTLHNTTSQITNLKQCVLRWVSIFQYYISEVQVNIYFCAVVLIWPCAVEAVCYLIYRKKRRKTKIGATQLSSLCNIAGGISWYICTYIGSYLFFKQHFITYLTLFLCNLTIKNSFDTTHWI